METARRILWAVAVVSCASACGGGAAQHTTATTTAWNDDARWVDYEARYGAVLESALADYERELTAAASRWYPTYTEAYAASQRFTDADVTPFVARALASHRVDSLELAEYAQRHPSFARAQRRMFQDRIEALRPTASAIMDKIDASRATVAEADLDR